MNGGDEMTTKQCKLIQNLRNLVRDVNVEEIAEQIKDSNLWDWSDAWRQEADALLDRIEGTMCGDYE